MDSDQNQQLVVIRTVSGMAAVIQELDSIDARILRYALGATLSTTLAVAFKWPVAFLTPLLTVVLLASPLPKPTLKLVFGFLINVIVAAYLVLLSSRILQPYPLVHMLVIGLALLWTYYEVGRRASPIFALWFLITLCALPLLMMRSQALSHIVGASAVFGVAVAFLVVWFSFLLVPDRIDSVKQGGPVAKPTVQGPTDQQRFLSALNSTIVVFPVLILFHTYQLASDLVILVLVALLSMNPDFANDLKGSKTFVLGNIGGGIVAIIFFELIVLIPHFVFFAALVFLTGLQFASGLFSGKPAAAMYGKAFIGFLLVIIAATSAGGEADTKVYVRVLQITLAVSYLVVAFGLLRHFQTSRWQKALTQ